MKKFLNVIAVMLALLACMSLAACGGSVNNQVETTAEAENGGETSADTTTEPVTEQVKEPTEVNVGVIKGPTGVGMVSLMAKNDRGEAKNSYNFVLASAPDEIVPKVVTGEIDMAAVPTNLACTLYKKTNGQIKMIAVNTLGVLHIVQNTSEEEITSIADLKGKTIYTTGQGANPEYILKYVLAENQIDPEKDVDIVFVGTNDELSSKLVSGDIKIAMIPEPAATTVISKSGGSVKRVLDMNDEWQKVADDCSLMMGCVIVRNEFLEKNKEAVGSFLKEYEESIAYCSDVAGCAALCETYGIIPKAAVAEKAIPGCNITFVAGEEMKNEIAGYFEVLFNGNPASIGGELPGDGLYYLG